LKVLKNLYKRATACFWIRRQPACIQQQAIDLSSRAARNALTYLQQCVSVTLFSCRPVLFKSSSGRPTLHYYKSYLAYPLS
jgi:hypothetical protein